MAGRERRPSGGHEQGSVRVRFTTRRATTMTAGAQSTGRAVRLRRDQLHLYFDAKQEPAVSVKSGDTIIFETEDANGGTIRKESDAYPDLATILQSPAGA